MRFRMGDIVRLGNKDCDKTFVHSLVLSEDKDYAVLISYIDAGKVEFVGIVADDGVCREFFAERFSLVSGPSLVRRNFEQEYDDATQAEKAFEEACAAMGAEEDAAE